MTQPSSRRERKPPRAHLNAIGTAVPAHDVHAKYAEFAPSALTTDQMRRIFSRMAARAGIDHRWSCLTPDARPDRIDTEGFYRRGDFPTTGMRMVRFEQEALPLARQAIDRLQHGMDRDWREGLTHLVVTCCTGFVAPGLDHLIMKAFGLPAGLHRTLVSFMGCNAAFNGLKIARDAVRSDPDARVLLINLELCTLHFQETDELERALLFLLFADGCAASIVSAEPRGLELLDFTSPVVPDSLDEITWRIGDQGFDMRLSGAVPHLIGQHLPEHLRAAIGERAIADVDLWAVHPGGRSVLDAVEVSLALGPDALQTSRDVLRAFGNMSSATISFVLERLMATNTGDERTGVAMGFGPGLGIETLLFREVSR